MVSRSQLPYVAMIAFGVVLVAVAIPSMSQGGYTHEVEPVSASEYESVTEGDADDEHAYRFSNLSTTARDAFRAAVDADDGDSVATTDERAPEFRYGDSTEYYYVEHDGDHYRLTASGADQLGDLVPLLMRGVALFGVLAIAVAGFELWRQE